MGLRRLTGLCLFLCALVAVGAPSARADTAYLKLDRVEAERSWFEGLARVRAYVTAHTLQGKVMTIHGESPWTLKVGASKKRIPVITGLWRDMEEELAIIIVVLTGFEYEDALPNIKRELLAFLDGLPDKRTQIAIIGYGERADGGHRLHNVAKARKRVEELEPDFAPADLQLIRAVDRAYRRLRRAEPEQEGAPLRKMIVVVSDGNDEDPEPKRYRMLGKKAGRQGIPIHSIGYVREGTSNHSLLGLGELSKQSYGTFRWTRNVNAFENDFQNLREELDHQYVLTAYLPFENIANRGVSVLHGELESNDVRVKSLTCGTDECSEDEWCNSGVCVARVREGGRGFFGWLLLILGIAFGAIVVLGLIGFVLHRLSERRTTVRALASAEPAADAAPEQPAAPAHHGIVPMGPDGRPVQPNLGRGATGQVPSQPSPAQPPQPAQVPPPAGAPPPRVSAHVAAQGGGGAPSLFVVQGPMQGQRLPLHHGFTIGKAPGCHLHIPEDPYASSHHAQILMDQAGNCTVLDKGSTNGTFVNGVRAAQMRLQHGMLIRIGQTEVRFLAQ